MEIAYDGWPSIVARVSGAGIPAVTILPGRTIAVDGRRVPTVYGTGSRWDPRRRARTSAVEAGGHRYELRPTGLCHARLTRDAAPVAAARGTLRAYLPFRSFRGVDARLTWEPGATPLDVALGQAMVLAFGAGAPGALAWIITLWLDCVSF